MLPREWVRQVVNTKQKTSGLSGSRRRPEGDEHTMSPDAVAKGIIDALARDIHEVALGPAARLHKLRDALFEIIND